MKTKRILASVLVLGLLVILLAQTTLAQEGPETPSAEMVDGAFTYQGRLTDDSGTPLTGTYDFVFKLYDAAGSGTQIGSTVTVSDYAVQDGLITTQLDFGSTAFEGDARWLEIGIRAGSSSGAYTTLNPRQALAPAPYALSLRPGAEIKGNTGVVPALTARNTNSAAGTGVYGVTDAATTGAGVWGYASSNSGKVHGVWGQSDSTSGYGVYGEAPQFGVYGEATRTSNYAYGVYGKAQSGSGSGVKGVNTATSGNAFGVYGSTDSSAGYAGYFSNDAGGVDVMAAGSGVIKSEADSVLYLSPHDMVVRGSSGVNVTPMESGGADIYYFSTGWKYLSLPVSTFGTLFGSPLYVKSVEVCYDTDSEGYIGVTSVIKNNGSTGSTNYIYDTTDRTSNSYACYTATDLSPAVIDNSTWVQFNIGTTGNGHTHIYTVKLTLTETP